MQGFLSLVLHAHLPFVRHPEHERSLEENWFFEAITETYIPLLRMLERWQQDGVHVPLTLTLTPTLCSMLQDPLLQARYAKHLDLLIDLGEKELHRTLWEKPFQRLALFYHERFSGHRDYYQNRGGDLLGAFRALQDAGALEIITSAATHAVLPLLVHHRPSLRAQVLIARDHYRACFGRHPRGIWLPECAYSEAVDPVLTEAGLRWFILETHGLLNSRPKPRFGTFAPVLTPGGLAAFGRDPASARQVWSRAEGYPGDPRYRDFYRDIGFDLDLDYLNPYQPAPGKRTFTGVKYYRITGASPAKSVYERRAAMKAADEHAANFLDGRMRQITQAAGILGRPPLVLAPYDAELFGHWWFEGPEFLDMLGRKAFYDQKTIQFTTPQEFLCAFPTHQVATPAASSWGEHGYWSMWLNEKTEWIYAHLNVAQERMSELVRQATKDASGQVPWLEHRALTQAGRELLLAQASDWPFILRTGTSPEYASKRIKTHLANFNSLFEQLASKNIDCGRLEKLEMVNNIFPDLNPSYWLP